MKNRSSSNCLFVAAVTTTAIAPTCRITRAVRSKTLGVRERARSDLRSVWSTRQCIQRCVAGQAIGTVPRHAARVVQVRDDTNATTISRERTP